jgi:hypothetical protein
MYRPVTDAAPIQRQGSSCPSGYYKNGDYCRANSADPKPAIARQGSSCPYGLYKQGDYCLQNK